LGGTFNSSANFLASVQLIFFSVEAFSTASKIAELTSTVHTSFVIILIGSGTHFQPHRPHFIDAFDGKQADLAMPVTSVSVAEQTVFAPFSPSNLGYKPGSCGGGVNVSFLLISLT